MDTEDGILVEMPGNLSWLSTKFKENVSKLLDSVLGIVSSIEPQTSIVQPALALYSQYSPGLAKEQRAWLFIFAALSASLDEVLDIHRIPLDNKRKSIEKISDRFGVDIDVRSIRIPMDFLDNPGKLPILKKFQKLIINILKERNDSIDPEQIAERLPDRFVSKLDEIWQKYETDYDALAKLLNHPFTRASARPKAWHRYKRSIEIEINKPLFGEPYSLKDLYQHLRGYWIDKGRDNSPEQWHLCDLLTTLTQWVDDKDPKDRLRVICGGPGSGKSSFTKMFAHKLLSRKLPYPVLRLELQRYRKSELEVEIERRAEQNGIVPSPIVEDGGDCWPLIILDGLDELDFNKIRGEQAARHVVQAVDDIIGDTAELNVKPLFLLAGRTTIVQAVKDQLDRPEQIFHLAGYFRVCEKDGNKLWLDKNKNVLWNDLNNLIEEDQRFDWYKKYSTLKNNPSHELPAILLDQENQLAQLSREPILLQLMAMAGIERFDRSSSINKIYEELLGNVFERSWGKGQGNSLNKQTGPLKPLTKEELWEIFEFVGLVVWQRGNSRNAKAKDIKPYLEDNLKVKYADFFVDAEKGTFALLTGFFFKQIEGESDPTFELTHKSFGEYLSAKRLIRFAKDHFKKSKDLQAWFKLTHQARITQEIIDFLEGEFKLLTLDNLVKLRQGLIDLFNENLQQGMPFEIRNRDELIIEIRNRNKLIIEAANAELALLCMIGAASRAIDQHCIDKKMDLEERREVVGWKPDWPDAEDEHRVSLKDLVNRLEYGTLYDELPLKAMRGIDIKNQRFAAVTVAADWCFSNAIKVSLSIANHFNANFTDANLTDAKLIKVNLTRADFTRADLTGAMLFNADLTDANLRAANLTYAILRAASLCKANLTDANLFNADLTDANLISADLTNADLTAANLTRANGLTAEQLLKAWSLRGARLDQEFMENPKVARRVREDPDLLE